MPVWGSMRRFMYGISPDEVDFSRRGFRNDTSPARGRLEQVGQAFVKGYHLAIFAGDPGNLDPGFSSTDPELQGFAAEGSAMGFALLDILTPWKRDRLQSLLAGLGSAHVYMIHVGVGWAVARLRRPLDKVLARMDPLLRWFVVDGYGFHEGYFAWKRSFLEHRVPRRASGYALRAFDQGLGRSLWFVDGADPDRISATVRSFTPERHSDLWSGLGLACAYAGGVDRSTIEELARVAGRHAASAAQGAAFAAKARERAGNPAPHTELACEVLCGTSAQAAASVTDAALEGIEARDGEPTYEDWRRRIRVEYLKERCT